MSRWAPRSPLRPGAVLDARFRVGEPLGQGSVGCVHEATDLASGERVAIKCLPGAGPPAPFAARRLLLEARIAAMLTGPHTVRVLGVGSLPDGGPFLAMELLQGRDLRAHLAAAGPLPPAEALELIAQACDGLAEAHRQGVVHRDIKPDNLFVARGPGGPPSLRVIDFGAASAPGEPAEPRLMPGNVAYLAPEQALAPEQVDPRHDLWSLGAVLFELLAGRPPFEAPTRAGLLARVLQEPAPALLPLRPGLPAALGPLLARCLARSPEHRPSSAAGLADELRGLARATGGRPP